MIKYQEKLEKAQVILIFLTIILLPFGAIPHAIQAIGSVASRYTLYLGLIIFVLEISTFKTYSRRYLIFFGCIVTMALVSLALGVSTYPYYNQVNNKPVEKFVYLLSTMPSNVNYDSILPYWLFLKGAKNALLDISIYFLFPYQVYFLFNKNWKLGFIYVKKAFLVLAVILGAYSLIEIPYLLFDAEISKKVLSIITPFYSNVSGAYGWWPPLLWKGQLRSLCPEPPHFGIIAAICEAFLIYEFIRGTKWYKTRYFYCFFVYFNVMIFLSRARTALGLVGGEILLFAIFTFYINNKRIIKKYICVLFLVVVSFLASILPLYLNTSNNEQNSYKKMMTNYVEENVASVAKSDVRSNGTRIFMAKACFEVGKEHLFLGVGKDLKDGYIVDYIQKQNEQDPEIKLWMDGIKERGILQSPFQTMNQFLLIFAENGIVGLLFFFFPLIFSGFVIWTSRNRFMCIKKDVIIIILLGQIAAMFSAVGWVTYPLFLGLLYAAFREENNVSPK